MTRPQVVESFRALIEDTPRVRAGDYADQNRLWAVRQRTTRDRARALAALETFSELDYDPALLSIALSSAADGRLYFTRVGRLDHVTRYCFALEYRADAAAVLERYVFLCSAQNDRRPLALSSYRTTESKAS
jgi:hypothetical protein